MVYQNCFTMSERHRYTHLYYRYDCLQQTTSKTQRQAQSIVFVFQNVTSINLTCAPSTCQPESRRWRTQIRPMTAPCARERCQLRCQTLHTCQANWKRYYSSTQTTKLMTSVKTEPPVRRTLHRWRLSYRCWASGTMRRSFSTTCSIHLHTCSDFTTRSAGWCHMTLDAQVHASSLALGWNCSHNQMYA